MKVLLIAPSGAVSAALDTLAPERDEQIRVVTIATPDADTPSIELGPRSQASRGRLAKLLQGSVVGRNLIRLTPMDGGRRFARAAFRDPRFRAAAAEASLIVALERDGILTAWKALRRSTVPGVRGVHGLAPARALLTESRAARS